VCKVGVQSLAQRALASPRVTQDGVVHWLAGLQVLALYVMIAIVTFALPGR